MLNNTVKIGIRVRHTNLTHYVSYGATLVAVGHGKVIGKSSYGDEWAIVEWQGKSGTQFPVSVEHVDDLIECNTLKVS